MTNVKLCPCGSGKSQAHCCDSVVASTTSPLQILVWAGIMLVVGVMTALALSSKDDTPVRAVARTPADWEYNPITNQHWDPRLGHEHWHSGPPPQNPESLPTTPDVGEITLGNGISPAATIDSDLPPALLNPEPWQYDPARNQHWFAEHGHWHDGLPPQGVGESGSVPENFEFDVENNRHWHGEHGHWHPGPPPG